ncbi:MAG: hypothetical protein GC200_00565 [Tepidisphaera sp.]|nr:hypothetical protein [Tepidisphaera sp.]
MQALAQQLDAWQRLTEPAMQHGPLLAAGGLVVGLVVLLAGAKLVRGGLLAAGAGLGGLAGYLMAPSIFSEPAMWGVSSGVIAAGLGAIAGCLLAAVLFRFAATAASAAGAAVLGVLVASVWFGFSHHDTLVPESTTAPAAQAWAQAAASAVSAPLVDQGAAPMTPLQQIGRGAEGVLEATSQLAQNLWSGASEDARVFIALGAAAGVMVGLALGVIAPKRAMALTTALAGAGLCVGCMTVLGPMVGIDTAAAGADRFALWAFGALLVFGVGVQWVSMRKPKARVPRAAAAG